ncbi:hypothetical protein NDU88_004597 [Pleurodeles waltl]|uniref:Prion/Doppel protein beta-ribbon domain-containing protein n=1 Tax=Pleurodeles waltl TaxID=8319 RepID=A0AAV7LPR7_PLEWA|nr:hypothetical protein NDU88_004597 [Pleurodeles waltl]
MVRATYACCVTALLVVMCSNCVCSIKGGGSSKRPSRPKRPVKPKTITPTHSPGVLLFRGTRLNLNFTDNEETIYYANNFTYFPDEIFYPWNPRANATILTANIFVDECFNVTVTKNNLNLGEDVGPDGDIHSRVMEQVIQYLCLGQYGKIPNAATMHLGLTLLFPFVVWITSLWEYAVRL